MDEKKVFDFIDHPNLNVVIPNYNSYLELLKKIGHKSYAIIIANYDKNFNEPVVRQRFEIKGG